VAYTVAIICLSIGGIVVSFLCLTVNIAFRKHRVIKMSSPHFNNITAVGGFICYLYVILGTVNHSRTYFGESQNVCTIGGLSTVQLMLGIFCIFVVDIVVLVSWNLIDPMQLRTVEISVNPNQEDIEIHTTTQQCVSNYYSSWIIGLILFKGALLLFGVFLAWETRNVHYAELNDSRNIGVAVYNILLFSGVSITAEFVLSDLMARRIFNNSVIYLCATMVLGLVFIPKISRLARRTKVQPDEGQQQNKTQISTSPREADSQASRE